LYLSQTIIGERHYPDPVSQKKIEIGLGEAVRQLVEVMNTWKAWRWSDERI